ncbi:hypothetical protein UC3_01985 [Enterococcus phoeniculicola ATCC BAA-412]|uniref:Uncharacterized protein n=1 Tax=Enterococcus phoeniculicola ATCC BAA-412 TaxID=1158610 RepID=R3TPM8_9ENTE|nr:hypothetical protein UC3_01985 [Enterococcus phoeniculicola ATCC BAA-412]EOT76634.1 hypothetical protein I589_01591 [Enterococcus phoeniculicola ATCC BAA-412]
MKEKNKFFSRVSKKIKVLYYGKKSKKATIHVSFRLILCVIILAMLLQFLNQKR